MNSRSATRALAVVLLVAGAGLAVPNPGRAATIESGWWSRGNTGSAINQPPAPPVVAPAPLPAPPAPPNTEGGLQVAALPDGALSIAAVRVDQELTSITLRVAPNGDANGMSANLAACAAATPWVPATNGPWDAKPVVACDLINGGGSVAGIRSEDGSTWTFPVGPLANDGKTDVVIVPLANSEVAQGFAAPFQLVFMPPTAADLVIASVTPEVAPTDDSFGADDSATDSGAIDGAGFSSFDPTFAAGSGAGATAPLVTPALDEADQAPVRPAFAAVPGRDNDSQLLGAAMVLLALGLFYWASRQATPPIHSLVGAHVGREIPVGEPQLGGLGQFKRARVGRPPALQ